MSKKMTLSVRILFGFLVVIAIAAVLGVSGWMGMRSVAEHVRLSDAGFGIVGILGECGFLRRDFALYGTEIQGTNTKNAAELWKDKYGELAKSLAELRDDPALDSEEAARVGEAATAGQQYEKDFADLESARKMRDDAFAVWATVGTSVTQNIGTAQTETIAPALTSAEAQADPIAISRWAGISETLHRNVVEEFLLLRVRAMYLIAKGGDGEYKAYVDQLAVLRDGVTGWAQKVQGEPALEQAAKSIGDLITQYETAGASFYDGLVKQRGAEAAMAISSANVLDNINSLQRDLDAAKNAIIARTVLLLMTL